MFAQLGSMAVLKIVKIHKNVKIVNESRKLSKSAKQIQIEHAHREHENRERSNVRTREHVRAPLAHLGYGTLLLLIACVAAVEPISAVKPADEALPRASTGTLDARHLSH